jgi:hypothetical protein
MSRRVVALAVALPLLAIVLGIVQAERFRRRAQEFVFEIGGYDPRDLLRGRYLQFRLRVDPLPEREPCVGNDCCLCLMRAAPGALSEVTRATCATARAECDGMVSAAVLGKPFRFYVPEERGAELERGLRDAAERRTARAIVAVDPSGAAQVVGLRIDGAPIDGGR